jgi:hypothetical protein
LAALVPLAAVAAAITLGWRWIAAAIVAPTPVTPNTTKSHETRESSGRFRVFRKISRLS